LQPVACPREGRAKIHDRGEQPVGPHHRRVGNGPVRAVPPLPAPYSEKAKS
jgi:hypothetical protein